MSFDVYRSVQFESQASIPLHYWFKINAFLALRVKAFNLPAWCLAIKSRCLLESILERFLEVIFAL